MSVNYYDPKYPARNNVKAIILIHFAKKKKEKSETRIYHALHPIPLREILLTNIHNFCHLFSFKTIPSL